MVRSYAIIDLFAGPGGLGEGFSRAGQETATPMGIRVSVEMDDHAIATLRLRSFLRSFDAGFPHEYYDALNTGRDLPRWDELHPAAWRRACDEARQLVLGQEGVFEELVPILDQARDGMHGDTILIGGPPCQAYSLAGRSRNLGKSGYVLEDDGRHYLYKEYVRILTRLRPAAFVMENVKGMLSSRVDGGGIFDRVLDDLEGAADGYRLLPLAIAADVGVGRNAARDFIVRAEDHGIPQARHRVIVVGLRSDLARGQPERGPLLLPSETVTVAEALRGLPPLRSGLSTGDSVTDWQKVVRDRAKSIADLSFLPDGVRSVAREVADTAALPEHRSSSIPTNDQPPTSLSDWLQDPRLAKVLHHETRGHIADDLGRYLFSSAFALAEDRAPKLSEFPFWLLPEHRNRETGAFADRFRTQVGSRVATTVTSHISKDGHYFIHPDPFQCRSLTVREAARLQTFPDNYFFCGPRTKQYHQVGNAVPPYLALQIARAVRSLLP
ncbi:DNA cytosine methyltransferase [Tabrizicola piscis]|uniref:DNA (cytosine-5-)-methyltransferase n=1 Tax=Tabrizicola piscis TaxID=2494374 RepID=A0A3S8U5T6_9RHOB|nr:DNA cytosine methyltransferase [Tabrizicola piscis]AZL58947.1 DNA cytosine methyltransferase [Tabrizicola piscis]